MKNNRGLFTLSEFFIVLIIICILATVVLMNIGNKPKMQAVGAQTETRLGENSYTQFEKHGLYSLTEDTTGVLVEGTNVRLVKIRRVGDMIEFVAQVRADRALTPYGAVLVREVDCSTNESYAVLNFITD